MQFLPNVTEDEDGHGVYFCLWKTLHQYAKNYPEVPNLEDRQDAVTFFRAFKKAIPCHNPCRVHYDEWFQKHPLEANLENRLQLQRYVYKLQKGVNTRNGKFTPPFEECMAIQEFNGKLNLTKISQMLREKVFEKPANETRMLPISSSTTCSSPSSSWWPLTGIILLFAVAGGILFCVSRRGRRRKIHNRKE